MWGYGGHGNLGLGSRRSFVTPQLVEFPGPAAVRIVSVACTVGQLAPKGGTDRKSKGIAGSEGPHTVAVAEDGRLYTWGTCHKACSFFLEPACYWFDPLALFVDA